MSVSKADAQVLQKQKLDKQLEFLANLSENAKNIANEMKGIKKELRGLGELSGIINVSKEIQQLEQQLEDAGQRLTNLGRDAEMIMKAMEQSREAELLLEKDAHRHREQEQEQEKSSDDFFDISLDEPSEMHDSEAEAAEKGAGQLVKEAFSSICKSIKDSLTAIKQEHAEQEKHMQDAAATSNDSDSPRMR